MLELDRGGFARPGGLIWWIHRSTWEMRRAPPVGAVAKGEPWERGRGKLDQSYHRIAENHGEMGTPVSRVSHPSG